MSARYTQGSMHTPNATFASSDQGPDTATRTPKPKPTSCGAHKVQPEVVATGGFSWERVRAFQCVDGEELPIDQQGTEYQHFVQYATKVLLILVADKLLPRTTILDKLQEIVHTGAADSVLSLNRVSYGQLLPRMRPAVTDRPPPADDASYVPERLFESFKATIGGKLKDYAQAPMILGGGQYYELCASKSLKFHCLLSFELELGDFDLDMNSKQTTRALTYLMRLSVALRSNEHLYVENMSAHEHCIKVELGHQSPTTERFIAWPSNWNTTTCLMLGKQPNLLKQLFVQDKWGLKRPAPAVNRTPGAEYDEEDGDSRARYNFKTIKHELCFEYIDKSIGSKEAEWIKLANFEIVRVLEVLQFTENDNRPHFKLLIRQRLSRGRPGGGTAYLSLEDKNRTPDVRKKEFVEVEVLVCLGDLEKTNQVVQLFQNSYATLIPSGLSIDQLKYYVLAMPAPTATPMIVRWGKQPDGWFVMQNVAFRNGLTMPLELSPHSFSPTYFNKQPLCPMADKYFPQILVIPFAHLRFFVAQQFWNYLMRDFFVNNEWQAKAVFALACLGLHADRFWKGESGLGHGHPVGWIVSRDFGTGKTEALKTAQSLLGFGSAPLIAGDATKAFIYERCNLQTNLTLMIDDIVPNQESKMLQQQIRSFYDHTERSVAGKMRLPHCGVMYSSNTLVNESDAAFQSRLLTIKFERLTGDNDISYDMYNSNRKLLSCLLPDIQQLCIWEGKLDFEALTDWAAYLNALTTDNRSRGVDEIAKLGFMLTLLQVAFGGDAEGMDKMIQMTLSMTGVAKSMTANVSVLEQFLLNTFKVVNDVGPNVLGSQPEKIVFWHNYRTTLHPPLFVGAWYAFRIASVLMAINAHLNIQMSEREIHQAIKARKHENMVLDGRAEFYDANKSGWPPKKTLDFESEDLNASSVVPLPENELTAAMTSRQRCVFFRKDFVDQILETQRDVAPEYENYKNVVIKSANKQTGSYNFYNALTGDGWFGFRSIENCAFAQYTGFGNTLYCGSPVADLKIREEVEDANLDEGHGTIANVLDANYMLKFFSSIFFDRDSCKALPAAYLNVPFESDHVLENPMSAYFDLLDHFDDISKSNSQATSVSNLPSSQEDDDREPLSPLNANKEPPSRIQTAVHKKKRSKTSLISEEAEFSGDDEEEEQVQKRHFCSLT